MCCHHSKRWFEGRHLSRPVYFAFVTGPHTTTAEYLDRVAASNPESSLLVVARNRPARGEWVEVREGQGTGSIIAGCLRAAGDRELRGAAVHATRQGGEWRMRLAALRLAGRDLRLYNDNLDHFRFGDTRVLSQHLKWRWKQRPRGVLWWRALARLAMACGNEHRRPWKIDGAERRFAATPVESGISLVIPTRDGRELLASMLSAVVADLRAQTAEIIVVDNGSSDHTVAYLGEQHPEIRIEHSSSPLSFSEAVNRGIAAARFSHVVLLNNDMQIEPGFFAALRACFERTPNLFCATAQIFFPEGQRREETGLCFWRRDGGDDFPVYCAEPQGDQDGALVLYGSGGCSMYDTLKLRELGGFDEVYRPAYVEDLDISYRAWQRGWPTVFCAGARVEHRHRATTSRYYSPEYLEYLVERNYLRFLVRATGDLFPELWTAAIHRLQVRACTGDRAARRALRTAWREGLARGVRRSSIDERALKQRLTK